MMMVRLSRSEISQIYHEGEEAVIALVESFQDALASLEVRLAAVEGQQKKTSKNSSKPPSSDGLRRTVSLRTPTGKKPGGQADHEGHTLQRSASPDEVIVHAAPSVCPECQHAMVESAEVLAETRQVFDVPNVAMRVTEHQVYARQCSCCGTRAKASFPKGINWFLPFGSRSKGLLPLARILLHRPQAISKHP
jgi:transposase